MVSTRTGGLADYIEEEIGFSLDAVRDRYPKLITAVQESR